MISERVGIKVKEIASRETKVIIIDEESSQILFTQRGLHRFIVPMSENANGIFFKPESGLEIHYKSNENIDDIYRFVFRCRVPKDVISYFGNKKENPYCIVSGMAIPCGTGEKFPTNLVQEHLQISTTTPAANRHDGNPSKILIFKYMMQGLHTFWIYQRARLLDFKIVSTSETTRKESTGEHHFKKSDAWSINMSNIFVGMMIDYYQIKSGIEKVNSQLAFISDPQYRYFIADMLKSIFLSFLRNTTHAETTRNQEFTNDIEIIRECALELRKLL